MEQAFTHEKKNGRIALLRLVTLSLLAIFFMNGKLMAQGTPPTDSDGDGRLEISTKQHLLFLSENLSDADMSAAYEQVNDIYFSDADFQYGGDFYNDGKGFRPIKASTGLMNVFYGSYDGQGFIIDGLYINRPSSNSVGFFADASGSVRDLGLTNVDITGEDQVGSIVGYPAMSITNCYATGTVQGDDFVGGLVGRDRSTNLGFSINNSHFDGNVSGDENVGGLVGDFRGVSQAVGHIRKCYVHGSVAGDKYVGGFAGYIKYVDIEQSYSTSSVSGNEDVGGFIGNNYHYGGYNIINSFWDTQTSGQSSSDGATGKTTSEMKNIRTYTDVSWSNGLSEAWDFSSDPYDDNASDDHWDINSAWNNGYPFYANGLKPEDTDGNGKLEITQVEHLEYLSESPIADLSADYEQMNDISFESDHFQNNGKFYNYGNLFNPIGDADNPFTGSYDGQGYAIDGLKISREDSDNIGFFGIASDAEIKNLIITAIDFVGKDKTGGIAGWLKNNSSLENCEVSGYTDGVEGDNYVGGLIGMLASSSINECYTDIDVNGSGDNTGGIAGRMMSNSTLENCQVSNSHIDGVNYVGGITGYSKNSSIRESNTKVYLDGTGDNIGGLVGANDNGFVEKSYSEGHISGQEFTTGGLVGWNKNSSQVINSYSLCRVTGNKKVGGLVAVNESSTISFCYAAAALYYWPPSGNSNVGGLVGISYNGTTTNSFYLSPEDSPLDSEGGTGKTTDELQEVSTYTDIDASEGLSASWDFINDPNDDNAEDNIWALIPGHNESYPLLFSGEGSQPVDNDGDGLLEIANRQDLLFLSQNPLADWTADYEQIADISFEPEDFEPGGDFYNGGQGFSPVGNDSDYFRGDYHGQGFSISGLTINRSSSEQVGMFGALFSSTIEDFNLIDVDIAGKKIVGALAGKAWRGKLNNVSIQGSVTANEDQAGGVVGLSDQSDFKFCEADVDVSGQSKVGGLAGEINNESTIEESSVQGTITADEDLAGGLVGLVYESTITASETNVDVSALSAAGGIAGKGYFAMIEETVAQGTVSADEDQAGGIIGWSSEDEIIFCESEVEVSASTEAGGITGYAYKGIINSCETNVNVSATTKAGGITGNNNRGTIENTSAYGTISAEGVQAGGIAGLSDFGDITGCEVDVNVSGASKIGGITGEFKNGTLINTSAQGTITAEGEMAGGINGKTWASHVKSCVANVDVSGQAKVGGITGSIHLYSSKILKTNAQGTVYATNNMAGGLAGVSLDNADIENSEADVEVTATAQAGGLVGKNGQHSSILASSAKGNVVCSDSMAGGLVGYNTYYGTIENCYATGNVEGDSKTGGLIGSNESSVLTSYSTGTVTGNNNTGGLIGDDNGGSVSDAFWDKETSGLTSSAAGTGKTTAEMKDVATFTDINTAGLDSAWDFVNNPNNDSQSDDYWTLTPEENQGYPYFFSPGEEPTDNDGDGTIEIYTKQHLLYLSRNPLADWSLNYKQMNDITFSSEDFQEGADFHDGGAGFSPIGNSSDKFSGTYNGNDYEISGLHINRPDQTHTGFFGFVNEGTISHLHIIDADITGNSNTGALIGEQNDSEVNHCSSSGEVVVNAVNTENIGGLIGKSQYGQVTRCHADVTITSTAKAVGGLIGYSRDTPAFSYALGNVSGKNEVGGLIGYNYSYNSTLQNCYARVDVTATLSHAGGLVGKNYSADIENCYATGSVSGTDQHLGGLIGENTGGWYFGSGDISNCFWDKETSGQTSSDGGTGKTTAEMKDVATYTYYFTQGLDYPDTWDFVGDPNHDDENNSWWNINPSENDGYPIFYSPGTPLEDSDNDGRLEIYTKADLLYLSVNPEADLSLSYEQMNDIQFEESDFEEGGDFYFEGKGFIPIGYTDMSGRFSGSYDGQGYIIDGLYINRPDESNIGVFKKIFSGNVEGLGVTNANIEGNSYTGAIAGQIMSAGGVYQCFATGNLSGIRKIGGITGRVADGSSISESYADIEISGDSDIGGIVGEARNLSSYSTDSIIINNCYSLSNVTATNENYPTAGGIAAYISKTKVENCFAAGIVTGDATAIGGAFGSSSNVNIRNVFWDTETSGQDASNEGTGKTTAEMKALSTFTDTNTDGLDEAWDFVDNPNEDSNDEDIWTMEFSGAANNGYPYLAWQEVPEAPPAVESLQAADIEATSAKAKGNILSTGNPLATQHGVIWNNSGNPTFEANQTEEGAATGNGEYASELTGLMPNRTYYYKAYAINDLDTVYGDEVSFTTSKKELVLAGSFAVGDKVYDGSVDAEITQNNLVLQGVEGSDVVTLESVTAQFDATNAGSAIVVNITSTSLGGSHSENYTIELEGAPTTTASISEKELTVTADDNEREQCAENPEFTFTYSGFVNGEDEAVLTTEPSPSCPANASSMPGDYEITLSGGVDENYAFSYVIGNLTIIEDTTAPVANTQELTLALNDSGKATITAEEVDNGSTDNCGINERVVMPSTFNCSHTGDNVVTLTVFDAAGNESSETAVITIEDNQAPTVITQNITVALNAEGVASITTADIDDGSSDNCSFETFELDVTAFDCSNVGENVVTLTAVDPSGNTTTQTAIVTVVDDIAPEVLTKDVTVELDATGQAAITTDDIDNGSADNCSIDSYQLDVSNFDCSNVGENVVTLTVTDMNGNTAEATAVVTVQDNMAPSVITQDFTAELDISGTATISVDDVDNDSYDNCSIETRQLDVTGFDCADIGDNTVTLTVTDVNGNEAQQTAIVTVEDNLAPTVITQDTLIELNPDGEANVAPLEIDDGSDDNCAIETYELDQTFFDESDIGENIVTLTVTDVHGNTTSETAIVTIADNTPPTIITQPVTLYLDMNGEATLTPEALDNGSYDNVEITNMAIDLDYFACGDVGEHTVTLTASDMSGNSSSATETVTVRDTIPPSDLLVEVSEPLCYGGTDGQIEIIPQDGSGDVLYSVDNGNTWQDDGLFTDLPDGTYNIVVEGANGCQTVYENNPVTLIQPEELVMDMVETTDATCYGASNGMLEAQASGGTGELYYSIDGGDTWQMNDGFFYGLSAGDYNVLVKDANDCLLDYAGNPVVISQPDAVVIEGVVANDITCNSAANGTIEINAFGGTGQLEYSINGGDTWQESPLFEGLAPGTYSIRVRDDNACLNIYDANPVTLTQPEALSFANVEVSDNTCYESNDGAIIADAQGGSGALEYSIDGGDTWQSDGSFEELPAGSYILMVQDENGCQFACEMNPITITQPEELVLSGVEATDITCYGQDNGTIEIFAGGGTGTLTYSIDDGANWQSSGEFTGLGEGAYDVWVKDANSCMTPWPENPVNITEPQELAFVDVSVSDVSCHGDEDGRIEVTGQGGTGALSYSINDGQSYMAVTTFDELEPGDYNLWMQDANGCTLEYGDNPITIENPEPLEVAINAEPGSDVLVGDTVTLSASTNYIVNYDWQPGGQSSAAIAVSSQEAGEQNYSVTVTNANNCTAMASQSIVFAVPTGVELDEAQAKIIVMPNPSDGRFKLKATGITAKLDVTIFDGTGNMVLRMEDLKPNHEVYEKAFNLSQHPTGMYYLKVVSGKYDWVKKIIIQQ